MKNKLKNYFFVLSLISMILLSLGGDFFSGEAKSGREDNTDAVLRDARAIEHLKQNGEYDSLMQAVRQARGGEAERENLASAESRYIRQAELVVEFGAANDEFGSSVAISGNTAVVGAWHDDRGSNVDAGAIHVFVRSSSGVWSHQAGLGASDDAPNDYFGYSVAIANVGAPAQTVIMAGAYGNDAGGQADRGAVYVFTRASGGTTWSSGVKLTASDGAAGDAFGNSIAINGNFAIIGANGENGTAVNTGAAYVFVRNGTVWEEEQKLTAWDGATDDSFGWSVAISGTRAVIGAPFDDIDANANQGSAYVFERAAGGNTWLPQTKLRLSSVLGATDDQLGYSVGVSGETVVAGAYGYDVGSATNQGSAFVWTGSGMNWSAPQALRGADGISFDFFASSLAISGDTLVIGSHRSDVSFSDQGAAYVFKKVGTNFVQQQKLVILDGRQEDVFGFKVAVSGDSVISSALWEDIGSNTNQGAAYIFALGDTPFDFDGDGKTDISIFRPAVGEWWYYRSSDGGNYAAQFGASTDKLVPGDFTGDGKTDIAIFRPASGEWFILRSEDGSYYSYPFGTSSDIPAVGDFDGDGKADSAVFRPSDTNWYIRRSSDGGFTIQQFGIAGDTPVVADYDGDGKSDIAIYRFSNGQWWIQRSALGTIAFTFGNSSDKPVQGDYTGDGKADVAIFRPASGEWFILRSENGSYYSFPFGINGDIPAPGDYDGDGRFDATVFRSSNSTWYVQRTSAGTLIQDFGIAGDKPVPNAFIP